jgi:hypothetical protein
VKVQPFFVRYTDAWILGPAASVDTRVFRIGLGLIAFEVGLCFISEKSFGYGCSGCGAVGEAPGDQLPPRWEKKYRRDSTYYFLCPNCLKEGRGIDVIDDDYLVTDDNREQAVDEIVGQLADGEANEVEAKSLRDYANKLLDESEPFSKNDLAASVAAYSDGFSDARKRFGR